MKYAIILVLTSVILTLVQTSTFQVRAYLARPYRVSRSTVNERQTGSDVWNQRRWIEQNNLERISRKADLADEAGFLADEAGRRQDEEGRRVDEAGRRVDEAGRRVDEAGRRVDEAGHRQDEAGLRQDQLGFLIDEAGYQLDAAGYRKE